MSQQPGPGRPSGDDEPPAASWMGAPGYTPDLDDLPPHAPMPGAPPYPAAPENPPAPVGQQARRTGFAAALAAAAVWAAVNIVLVIALPSARPAGADATLLAVVILVPTAAAALGVWLIARRRAWPFGVLVLIAAPLYWVLRAFAGMLGG